MPGGGRAGLGHLVMAAQDLCRQGVAGERGGCRHRGLQGVDHRKLAYLLSGIGAAYAGVAGTFIALIATLAPAQIWAWLEVVFAVVIIGRLGNPLGALFAGLLIGASRSIAMAVLS